MKTLTIAIPTWNRASKIDAALVRIASWTLPENVFIRVHDNGSSDGTAEVLAKWRVALGSRFSYKSHPYNLGLVKNYLSCISDVDTDFVWVLGDDDVVEDFAVAEVVAAMSRDSNTGLIVLNYRPVVHNQGAIVEVKKSALPEDLGRRFPNGRDCFEACLAEEFGCMMYISVCVLNRTRAMNAYRSWGDRDPSDLAIPLFIAGVCATSGVYFVYKTCFTGLYNQGSWKKRMFSVYRIQLPRVLKILHEEHGYPKSIFEPYLSRYSDILSKPRAMVMISPREWWRARTTAVAIKALYLSR